MLDFKDNYITWRGRFYLYRYRGDANHLERLTQQCLAAEGHGLDPCSRDGRAWIREQKEGTNEDTYHRS